MADRGDLQQIRGTSVFLSGVVYVMENDSQEPISCLLVINKVYVNVSTFLK